MGNAAFETLIANNSYIKNLTSTQIVITKDNGDVVAGMANGTYLTVNNNDHNITESNGVRIWAGPMATAGNVASAPFTVDEEGNLKATKASITGEIHATSGTMSNVTVTNADVTGTLHYNKILGNVNHYAGSATISNDTVLAIITQGSDDMTINFPLNPE
jgi:predicted phage tail protein